jgi:predicted DNA-binding transcriptional regulator YafY
MDKLERAYCLHKIFQQSHYPVSLMYLCDELQCKEATVKRLIYDMRLYLDAPIINKPGHGYYYAKNTAFELPGIWFSANELHALLTIEQLTSRISGGFLGSSFAPLHGKIESILNKAVGPDCRELDRIRILEMGARSKKLLLFPLIADAVLQRKRITISYFGRQRQEEGERTVSAQRLIYYKSNWYLDAWCHKADDLRTFALEKISRVVSDDGVCRELDATLLDKKLASSYGIFSGEPTATAVLRFTPEAAVWVADEAWFPDCTSQGLEDGRYELHIPYNNPTELILEICRHGPDVEVMEPPELRDQVAKRLATAAAQYAPEITI